LKTQAIQSTPSTVGPFLRLILTLTAAHEAEPEEDLKSPASEARNLSVAAASREPQAPQVTHQVSTHATTLGPFLTLLLTLHNHSSWIEREWWESSTAPRGAALAARYTSR
jgi:hypothetical protein